MRVFVRLFGHDDLLLGQGLLLQLLRNLADVEQFLSLADSLGAECGVHDERPELLVVGVYLLPQVGVLRLREVLDPHEGVQLVLHVGVSALERG